MLIRFIFAFCLFFGWATYASADEPLLSITQPATNTNIDLSADLVLSSEAIGDGFAITRIDYLTGSTLLGRSSEWPYSVTVHNLSRGVYAIRAKMFYTGGSTTAVVSAPISVTVGPLPSVALVSPVEGASFPGVATINLMANATAVDASVSKVEFYRGNSLLGTATGAPFSFSWYNVPLGTFKVSARVYDTSGLSKTSDVVSFTVANPIAVAISSPLSGSRYLSGSPVTLRADATDSAAAITKVEFWNGADLVGTTVAPPFETSWLPAAAGKYRIIAVATDTQGITRASSASLITVNTPPTVSLMAPSTPITLVAPVQITLEAAANDLDGHIQKVEFYSGGTLLGTSTSAPYTYIWSNEKVGKFTLTARATDDMGGVTISDQISLKIESPISIAITSPTTSRILPPASLTLQADATDSKGTILKVEFYNGADLIGVASSSPFVLQWNDVKTGIYRLTAVATDSLGYIKTSGITTLTVDTPPSVILTAPSKNSIYSAPGVVALLASVGDPDGTIRRVDFFNGTVKIGSATTAPYTFTWENVPTGDYTLYAKAFDDIGTGTRSPGIGVHIQENAPLTLAVASGKLVMAAPSDILLNTNASAISSTVIKVEFFSGANLIGTSNASPFSLNWKGVEAGKYTLKAVMTDGNGATFTSAVISASVIVDALPQIGLSSDKVNVVSPDKVLLTAAASDTDGTISKVEIFNGTTLIATLQQSPYVFEWQASPGSYKITAKATDNLGGTNISPILEIIFKGPASKAYYIHTDHLDTPRVVTNQAGAVVWAWESDAFGVLPANEVPSGSGLAFTLNLRYPGQYFDRETNLHYNQFRDYDPQTGRYIQSDPIGLAGGINTYAYVGANPLNGIDPLGLAEYGYEAVPETGVDFIKGVYPNWGKSGVPMRPIDKAPSAKKLQCMKAYIHEHYFGQLGDFAVPTLSANSMYDNEANLVEGGPAGNLKEVTEHGVEKVVGVKAINAGATGAQSAAVAAEAVGAGSSAVNGAIVSVGAKVKSLTSLGVRWAGRAFIPATVAATYANQKASEACSCE